MNYKNIKIETNNQLAFIIINRPEVRNALNMETVDEIQSALHELELNETIQCVVFTGGGEKSFAAGADISQLKDRTGLETLVNRGMQQVYDYIESYPKPTIAMVNGYALGGGCELAMSCDIRIASTNAKLGLPELNLSIIPGAGGTQRLARLVGKGKALEMILTGKIVSGEEAKMCGLVSELVQPKELLAKTEEVAEKIISKGPLAVRLAKLSINAGLETDIKTGLVIEKLAQALLMSTEDKKEGTQAFLEKRKPKFQGK